MQDMLIENASQILTMEGAGWEPLRGERQNKLRIKEGQSILIRGNRIIELLTATKKEKYLRNNEPKTIDARGNVVMPGIIDSHTHLVYGGTREDEFFMKIKGKSYLEILNSGNGIYATVNSTRKMSEDQIFSESLKRIYDSIFYGTTTVEIKTGYGLNLATELKMLSVIERISSLGIINVVPTFLGMHAIPKGETEGKYTSEVLEKMAPKFAGKVKFVDVFCDKGAFTPESTREMALWGVRNNIRLKLHADELEDVGCLDLCDEFEFASVDHLLKTNRRGIEKISKSGSVATFLPITAHSIGNDKYPDIKKFIDSGIPVAIGSDASP
ncbi:MAG TPA: imidazolonepropionase, partial [Thermoplasmataceae archaeon]|nr:imidazolonepropionase [Thermoplasmataceae archaeon]